MNRMQSVLEREDTQQKHERQSHNLTPALPSGPCGDESANEEWPRKRRKLRGSGESGRRGAERVGVGYHRR
jgi:hypothetical protein